MYRVFESGKTQLIWLTGELPYATATLHLPDPKILDIGSGQSPHPAATVLVDKYWFDNAHRMGQRDATTVAQRAITDVDGKILKMELVNTPKVGADIIKLPFPDKSFDFVICSHILEHIEDVQAACLEISRVGRMGFIEVPTFASELFYPQGEIHLWSFERSGPRELTARSVKGFQSPYKRLIHELHWSADRRYMNAWAESRLYLHVIMFWTDELTCRIGEPHVGGETDAD